MSVHFNRTIQNMCEFVLGSCCRMPAVKKDKRKEKKKGWVGGLGGGGGGSSRTVPVQIYSASVTVQCHKMLACMRMQVSINFPKCGTIPAFVATNT